MEMRLDAANLGHEVTGPSHRLIRLALVVYLFPAILVVLAIGLIGMLAPKT